MATGPQGGASRPVCEHCKSSRYRKYTYIVRNTETGEFKQVGKSCLQDFTNGLSAEAIAQYISGHNTLIEGEASEAGCSHELYIETETALKFVAETIRKFGYVRKWSDEKSTAARAFNYYLFSIGLAASYEVKQLEKEMDAVNFNHEAPEVAEQVKGALEWIAGQDETNNYFHNLKIVSSLEYVKAKNFGLLASLFPAYDRELVYQAKKAEEARKMAAEKQTSNYIGAVKDRISITVQSIKCVTSWETDFGVTRIYKITDAAGNVFIWKTGKILEDDVQSIVGTVKAHNEYKGVKQTEITRCKVAA